MKTVIRNDCTNLHSMDPIFCSVSGVHARLEKKKGVLYITDLDSTNGTFINNRRIRPGAVTPVAPGSHITFGMDAY